MNPLDVIRRRQSTRRYRPDPVPRETLDRCLEAARLAPSACNSQPWRFHVVDDPALLPPLRDAAFSGLYSMCAFARAAPVLIAVQTLPSAGAARFGGLFRGTEFNLLDVGAAVEHLVLQAEAEGLGTCWIGWFDAKAVKRVLGLPRSARLDVMISLGWPDEPEIRPKNRRPLEEIRRYVRSDSPA